MQTQRIRWTVGALALFGSLAIAGASHASCTGDNRLGLSEANCLRGGHTNSCESKIFGQCISPVSYYWAMSRCSEQGTVVAKVDIAGGTDKTWHLNDNRKRSGESSNHTRGVYCCDDLGLCNVTTPDATTTGSQ